MFRLLFAFLIIYFLYLVWKKVAGKKNRTIYKSPGSDHLTPGEMVSCAKCETFVLKSEAVEKGGKYYCSRHCIS